MVYNSLFKKLLLIVFLYNTIAGELVLAKHVDARLFLSTPPPGSGSYYTRAAEWREPVNNDPFSVCANNKNPETDFCYLLLNCTGSTGNGSHESFVKGFRLTGIEVRQAFLSLAGNIFSPTTSACVRYNPPGKPAIIKNPFIQVDAFTEDESGRLWQTTEVYELEPAEIEIPVENVQCQIKNKNLEINFGNILLNEANGSERTVNLGISCTEGKGYAQLSIPGYVSSGIALRPDNSLKAKISLGDGRIPAETPGTYIIEANTTRNIPITVTLKALPTVKSGEFNASTVIHINYI